MYVIYIRDIHDEYFNLLFYQLFRYVSLGKNAFPMLFLHERLPKHLDNEEDMIQVFGFERFHIIFQAPATVST